MAITASTTLITGSLIGDLVSRGANSIANGAGGPDGIPTLTQVATVNVSACLELQSTTGALLVPRMTTTQRTAMTTIVNGMLIYNTTTAVFNFYQNGAWLALSAGAGGVVGPGGGSTDNAVARWDGAGGATLQDSVVIVGDTGAITGVLTVASDAATAAAPSYTFTGDLDTGIYHSAANTVDISAGGTRQVSVTTAVAVNYVTLTGSAGASPVLIGAAGTDANININLVPKGTGGVLNAVGATATPSYSFVGRTDTGFWSSAAATIDASSTGGRNLQIKDSTGVTANYLTIQGTTAGNGVIVGATGSDTDVSLSFVLKGAGAALFPVGAITAPSISFNGRTNVGIYSSAANTMDFVTNVAASQGRQLQLVNTASAVNYVTITGSATGSAAIIATTGTDATVNLQLFPKGTTTGQVVFPLGAMATPSITFLAQTNTGIYSSAANTIDFTTNATAGNGRQFQIANNASAVDYISITGAATNAGNAALQPSLVALGTDTNIDVAVVGKGSGGFSVLPTASSAGKVNFWNPAGTFKTTLIAGTNLAGLTLTLPIIDATANADATVSAVPLSSSTAGVMTFANTGVRYAAGTLTNGQITNAYTTPIELIPAPGANLMVVIHKFAFELVYIAATFTSGGAVYLQYGATAHGTNYATPVGGIPAAFMQNTASFTISTVGEMATTTGLALATTANAAITYTNATGVFATGDATGRWYVWYSIVPTT